MKKGVFMLLAVLTACIATAQENTDYPGVLQISALRDKALLQRIASSEKPSVGTPEYEALMQEIADRSLTAVRAIASTIDFLIVSINGFQAGTQNPGITKK